MMGDYFNDHGEEDNMSFIARDSSTVTDTCLGLELRGVGYGENGEPYILITKNGAIDPVLHEANKNAIECRISLLEPRYIQYDEKLTKNELSWVKNIVESNWDLLIGISQDSYDGLFRYGSILKPDSVCPDYSTLETID